MDIQARRGDHETYDLALTQASGAALNLTGATVWFTAKHRASDADADAAIAKSSPAGGITIANAAEGLCTLELEPDDTADLGDHLAVLAYDVQVRDAANRISTPLSGRLLVAGDIRRATT